MELGRFIDGGRAYQINTPVTPTTWSNTLFNDEYRMELSQTLQGKSSKIKDYKQETYTTGYRYFYVLNHRTGEAFNPNYVPLRRKLDEFSCVHGLNATTVRASSGGIECSIRAMVPVSGVSEIWTVTLKNCTQQEQELSLFTVIGLADSSPMGGICDCDPGENMIWKYSFPYHVRYEEKAKVEAKPSHYYMICDVPAASYEMSRRRFWGSEDMGEYPAALIRGACSNLPGEAEEFCAGMQHRIALAPGGEFTCHFRLGIAGGIEEIISARRVLNADTIAAMEKASEAYWNELCGGWRVETPDENINSFANYWLKKQVTLLTRQNRGGVYCPVRNQLQDALGYALVQPHEAKKFVFDVLRLQQQSGFIKQWYMTDGSPDVKLCLVRHTDGPLWLVIAATALANQLGDSALYEESVPYKDGGEGPVYEHLFKAVEYMFAHRGAHGLSLVGDGDWNDPINGMGRMGRGESAWSTFALIYCINLMLEHMVDETAPEKKAALIAMRDELLEKVNAHCWMDGRYIVGFDDEGYPVGSAQDNNRLFLNTQTWAIIAGAVDGEKLPQVLSNIASLETPFGPALLDRPFDEWDPRWGRISIKKAGTTENGSVYCHASMFKAYSDAVRGDGDALYDTVKRTLPTNPDNPPEVNLQLPIYVSNYYYTLKGSANYGRSSCHEGTGTVAWMLMVMLEGLVGVKATTRGVKVEPCLPEGWEHIACTRRFKHAQYEIAIHRGERKTLVDGQAYDGEALPCEEGRTYRVEVWR